MSNADSILTHTTNRVYPIPDKKWKYYQEWHNTLFFHWKVAPSLLEKYIPKDIQLDTIEDTAWVSLVAFEVKKMRLRNLPGIPYINNFHEINIRTYVIKDGIPGIYMFSIETDKFIEVLISRLFIGLPYQKADIERNEDLLLSFNTQFEQYVSTRFKCHGTLPAKTKTDIWLTERHCLYEYSNNELYRFDIHHKEWNLKKLYARMHFIKYKAGDFSLDFFPDKTHCCEKLRVLLWAKQNVQI
jgi:uncharacterized protein YqjF (DUF2071 family)